MPVSLQRMPHPWPPLPPSSDWPLAIVLSAGFINLGCYHIRATRPLLAACRELCGFIAARDVWVAERLACPVLVDDSGTSASTSAPPPSARFGYIVAQEQHRQALQGWPIGLTVVEEALRQVLLSRWLRPSDIAPLWEISRSWNTVLFNVSCEEWLGG